MGLFGLGWGLHSTACLLVCMSIAVGCATRTYWISPTADRNIRCLLFMFVCVCVHDKFNSWQLCMDVRQFFMVDWVCAKKKSIKLLASLPRGWVPGSNFWCPYDLYVAIPFCVEQPNLARWYVWEGGWFLWRLTMAQPKGPQICIPFEGEPSNLVW